jgi:hypothetical protein
MLSVPVMLIMMSLQDENEAQPEGATPLGERTHSR